MNKKGFTFIELVVVVTIVIILSMGAILNFSGGNKKARDSRRKADLEKIRVALELYRQSNGNYPATYPTLVPNYLDVWPSDPTASNSYYYTRKTDYTYDLCSTLDVNTGVSYCGGSNCGGVCYYKVTNP